MLQAVLCKLTPFLLTVKIGSDCANKGVKDGSAGKICHAWDHEHGVTVGLCRLPLRVSCFHLSLLQQLDSNNPVTDGR